MEVQRGEIGQPAALAAASTVRHSAGLQHTRPVEYLH